MSQTTIPTGRKTRLLLREYQSGAGATLVAVAPQFLDRAGEWKLSHSGLILAPDVARDLAPALVTMATTIDGGPPEPCPTAEDIELSRRP